LAVGLTDRITVTAEVPLVTTRSQVDLTVDSTNADLGWNQAAPGAANPTAVAEIQALLMDLETAASFVEGQIAAMGYDCPTGPICDQARDAVLRARRMQTDIMLLSGVDATTGVGGRIPAHAPIEGSAPGLAVTNAIATLVADLQGLGAPSITGTLPLPSAPVTRDDIDALLTDSIYG
jgi:hypothetical protein